MGKHIQDGKQLQIFLGNVDELHENFYIFGDNSERIDCLEMAPSNLGLRLILNSLDAMKVKIKTATNAKINFIL